MKIPNIAVNQSVMGVAWAPHLQWASEVMAVLCFWALNLWGLHVL